MEEGRQVEFSLGELLYANDLEKAYGLSQEQYLYYCDAQRRLARFDSFPEFSADTAARFDVLAKKKDWLAERGFAPSAESDAFASARVDFVHSTCAYEGSVMTVFDTAMILKEGATIQGKPLADHLEVIDAARAFDVATAAVEEGRHLSTELICELHAIAAEHLESCQPGILRAGFAYVTGTSILPPPPELVPELLQRAVDWYNESPSPLRAVGFHLYFEDIHPFKDGNGRCGRIIANYMLMSLGYPVVGLKADSEHAAEYHKCISEFAREVESRKGDGLAMVFHDAIDRGLSRAAGAIDQAGARECGPRRHDRPIGREAKRRSLAPTATPADDMLRARKASSATAETRDAAKRRRI